LFIDVWAALTTAVKVGREGKRSGVIKSVVYVVVCDVVYYAYSYCSIRTNRTNTRLPSFSSPPPSSFSPT
jgi:hypothetical protein